MRIIKINRFLIIQMQTNDSTNLDINNSNRHQALSHVSIYFIFSFPNRSRAFPKSKGMKIRTSLNLLEVRFLIINLYL